MRTVPPLPGPEERILDGVFHVLRGHVAPGVRTQHVAHLRRGKGVGVREGGKQAGTIVLGILQVMVVLRVSATFDGCARGPGWHTTDTQIRRRLGAVELDAPIVFGPGATLGDRGTCGGCVATADVWCRARRGVDRAQRRTIGVGRLGDLCYSHGINLHGRGRLTYLAVGEFAAL